MAKCISCGSNAAKKLSMIQKEGTREGTSMGVGIGGGGIGIGSARTKSKSDLAKDADYKAEETGFEKIVQYGCTGFVIFCGFVLDVWLIPILISLAIIILSSLATTFGWLDKEGQDVKHQEYLDWHKTWMCLDCGHKWVK